MDLHTASTRSLHHACNAYSDIIVACIVDSCWRQQGDHYNPEFGCTLECNHYHLASY
jgi:hypothetical protein